MGDQRDGITTFDSFLSRICNLHSVWYGADVVLTLGKRRAPGSVMEFCTLQARKEPRAGNIELFAAIGCRHSKRSLLPDWAEIRTYRPIGGER